MNTAEKIKEDLNKIYLGNLNTVDKDLKLPVSGKNGSLFCWTSGEERFITSDGKVKRPLYGMGNRRVTLTCRAELNEQQLERLFEITVLQEEKKNQICRILPVMLKTEEGSSINADQLPSVVIAECEDGRFITLPVSWEKEAVKQTQPKTETKTDNEIADIADTVAYQGMIEGTVLKAYAEVCSLAQQRKREKEKRADKQQLHFYPVQQIRLLPGSEYADFQQRMNEYLLGLDEDRLLYNFRSAAGLDTKGAEPMTGWDARECKLRGHTTGHFLSGLALAWAATDDERFRKKIDYMVQELAACREAFAKSGKVKPGYFGSFDEEQFDLLEQYTKYPEIWAPYYTLEKLMSGLYDIHTLEGNPKALELLKGLGDWTYDRLSRLSKEKRKNMWSMYIAGEFGGMISILTKLYGLTGEERYLTAAGFFYNDKLFYPMEQNVDTLEDMHANQHIPQVMGAMELYRVTGEEKYYRIGRNFWEMVTGHHCYRIGGTGETEMFHGRDCEEKYLTDKTAESCASYNMLRLTGQLFAWNPDGVLMDYYENTLLNHILSTAAKDNSGGTTYFLPLEPGGVKEYDTEENSCCHGTGMESRYRFMEHIYAQDESCIYVNLYVPSVLENMLQLSTEADGTITIKALQDMSRILCLRIPAWADKKVTVQSVPVSLKSSQPDRPSELIYKNSGCLAQGEVYRGYFKLRNPLKAGEELRLQLPVELREVPVPGSSLKCLANGPHLMAAVSRSKTFLSVKQAEKELVRLNTVDKEPYHVYFS